MYGACMYICCIYSFFLEICTVYYTFLECILGQNIFALSSCMYPEEWASHLDGLGFSGLCYKRADCRVAVWRQGLFLSCLFSQSLGKNANPIMSTERLRFKTCPQGIPSYQHPNWCPGDLSKVESYFKNGPRQQDKDFSELLALEEVPDLTVPQEKMEEQARCRQEALAGESVNIWAIQKGDDAGSRQPLPQWIGKPLEKQIVRWGEENIKWQQLISERSSQGKALTAGQKRKHDEWAKSSSDVKMLFNRQTKSHVTRLRSNACMKNVQKNMFSISIALTEDPNNVQIQAGNGEICRLVLLKGEPVAPTEEAPLCIDAGLHPGALEMQQAEPENEAEQNDQHVNLEEQEELLKQDLQEMNDPDEDAWQVLADSSDEELPDFLEGSKTKRVKSFSSRPAYKALEQRGLTLLPQHITGVHLAFHSTSRTWQGHYPNCHHGLSFTFGGSTKRTLVPFMCMCNHLPFIVLFLEHTVWRHSILLCFRTFWPRFHVR